MSFVLRRVPDAREDGQLMALVSRMVSHNPPVRRCAYHLAQEERGGSHDLGNILHHAQGLIDEGRSARDLRCPLDCHFCQRGDGGVTEARFGRWTIVFRPKGREGVFFSKLSFDPSGRSRPCRGAETRPRARPGP